MTNVLLSIEKNIRRLMSASIAAIVLAGCDPCAGVSCSTTPHVTLTGTIVDHVTGAGVPRTKIGLHVVDAGGQSADASAMTDGAGVWQATTKLQTSGHATANVTVTSPNSPTYTVTIPVESSTRAGDATTVGLWTELPCVRQLLSVLVNSQPLVGASVHFQQTSGATVIASRTNAETDGSGVFELDFSTETLGAVVGVLTITHPSLLSPIVIPDLAIQLDYHFGIPRVTGTVLR